MTPRRAFTAVELLGTTALLALLMAAVLAVIASLSSPRKLLAATETASVPSWQESVVELLRQDLAHAQSVKVDRHRQTVTIQSLHCLDAVTRQSTHSPIEVTYYLQVPASEEGSTLSAALAGSGKAKPPSPSVLVRKQVTLDEPTNRNTWADVVCTGVRSCRLLVIQSTPPEGEDQHSATASRQEEQEAAAMTTNSEIPWPQRVRLILQWADEKQPLLDRTLQLY